VLAEGPADQLDHATVRQFVGGKLGVDATAKLPGEDARDWPAEIEMSAEIRALVDGRWADYGL
jgi:4-hydroxy-3-polyprenylbenzoate decarboxylase